jgi:hypothetical protein
MKFDNRSVSGIILIVGGIGQFLGIFVFPIWLVLICVGLMFIVER